MVIELENWKQDKSYSTTGLTDEYTDILGVPVVKSVIPVRPGRNISIVIETAAVVNRQKKMGYNAAEELSERLTRQMEMNMQMEAEEEEDEE